MATGKRFYWMKLKESFMTSDTIDYFKEGSKRTGVPYQTIINPYLGECVAEQKRLAFS